MLPIVDTHQHLWDLDAFQLPWLASVPALNRTYLTGDYLAATAGLNVVKAIYMEVDVAAHQQVAEAEAILKLCAEEEAPTVAAVISGRPASREFPAYIRRLAESSAIKGVRQVLHVPEAPRGLCLDAQFVENVQLLGALNLRYDICMRPEELADAVKLVDQCPQTRFIVDHCGNANPHIVNGSTAPGDGVAHTRAQWMEDMAALAARPNTVCKISGIIAQVQPGWRPEDLAPTVNHCLDSFGPDRVVFGGDWPVCTLGANVSYRSWVEALKKIVATRSEAHQRKLFHDNAIAFYELEKN